MKKKTALRIINLIVFGIFSTWFQHKAGVEFFSWDYAKFMFFTIVLCMTFDINYAKENEDENKGEENRAQ